MTDICVIAIFLGLILMCLPRELTSSTCSDVISRMHAFFDTCPHSTIRAITYQAMCLRAGEPGTYHKYAHELASTKEGPEYALSLLEEPTVPTPTVSTPTLATPMEMFLRVLSAAVEGLSPDALYVQVLDIIEDGYELSFTPLSNAYQQLSPEEQYGIRHDLVKSVAIAEGVRMVRLQDAFLLGTRP